MDFVPFLCAVTLALLCLLANAATAVEETQDKRCISLMRIDSVEVLDSQHLVFHMHGRKNYLNVLHHRCPGLRRNQPLMYRTSRHPEIASVHTQNGCLYLYTGICPESTLDTFYYQCLPVFRLFSSDLAAHARSDAAIAAFTLSSTLKSNDSSAKTQATGTNSGLAYSVTWT